jgi:hypothetical protein
LYRLSIPLNGVNKGKIDGSSRGANQGPWSLKHQMVLPIFKRWFYNSLGDKTQESLPKKTRSKLDEFMRVPDAAHADLAFGLNAPTLTFHKIGQGLRRLAYAR